MRPVCNAGDNRPGVDFFKVSFAAYRLANQSNAIYGMQANGESHMPVVGRKPKPEDQRRNKNPHVEWLEVVDRPFAGAPSLPKGRRITAALTGEEFILPWPTETKRWWRAVSRMPHCVLWSDTDWQFALDTVLIAAAFHAGDMKQAVELRQREKVMGTTLDSRRDLRIRYVEAVAEAKRPSLIAIEGYRKALQE
jgi:hypothetical protein